jgi:2-(3-amino-3-carboxypropyl)histidine synthase
MISPTFDFEVQKLKKEIRTRKSKLVLIQLPEGLKPHGWQLAKTIEELGTIAIVSADHCYGGCDLPLAEAKSLGADLIVHYGHSQMVQQNTIPTIYIETKAKAHIKNVVWKAVPHLEQWKKIGLITTIQHVENLREAEQVLLEAGKAVSIGNAGQMQHPGQITGCNYSNAKVVSDKVSAFLYIGGGKFHPIGVTLATRKPTIVADPFQKKAFKIQDEATRIIKKRWANIQQFKQAKRIGIIIGLKPGQKRYHQALKFRDLLSKASKQTILLALKEITPEVSMQFPTVEAFINTACPRITLDDSERFLKPIITPLEGLVAIGQLSWGELWTKGWFED